MGRKNLLILVFGLLVLLFGGFAAYYISSIHFIGKISFVNSPSHASLEIITPLGKKVQTGQEYEGYCRAVYVTADSQPDVPEMHYKGKQIPLQLQPIEAGRFELHSGHLGYLLKTDAALHYTSKKLVCWLNTHAAQLFSGGLLLIFLCIAYFNRKRIRNQFLNFTSSITPFIVKQNYRLALPVVLSAIPGALFGLFCNKAMLFLQITVWEAVLASTVLLSIPFFLLIFSRQLKTNFFFWISFITLLITLYTAVLPDIYLYGNIFRDDISKYFVKAYSSGFFEAIAAPDANYLAVFQSAASKLILSVFSISYFPEILQLFTLICIVLVCSSFNLRIYGILIKSEKTRFAISLIMPLVFFYFANTFCFHSIPFLVAVLFLSVIIIPGLYKHAMPAFLIAIFFGGFILSKPIFILFFPIIAIMLISALVKKDRNTALVTGFWLLCMLIQVLVNMNGVSAVPAPATGDLGTHYDSAYSMTNHGVVQSAIISIYLFVRLIPSIFLPFVFSSVWVNILINIISAGLILFFATHSIRNFITHKSRNSLMVIMALFIGYLSMYLFTRTGIEEYFLGEGKNIFTLKLSDLAGLPYLLPHHRYLLLANIPMIGIVVYYLSKRLGKIKKGSMVLHVSTSAFIIAAFVITEFVYNNNAQNIKHSLWRQYNNLIIEHPDSYYMPYYGYPKTSECIKHGCDRITDFQIPASKTLYIDSLNYCTENWQVIQLVTEYEPEVADQLAFAYCITRDNDTLAIEPAFPIHSEYRFVIFRLEQFHKLKQIIFTNNKNEPLQLIKPVRLVGWYD